MIDELNTDVAGPELKTEGVSRAAKKSSQRVELTVFATGTNAARSALAVDDQLDSRFEKGGTEAMGQ